MKVFELIRELTQYEPDAEVRVWHYDGAGSWSTSVCDGIEQTDDKLPGIVPMSSERRRDLEFLALERV